MGKSPSSYAISDDEKLIEVQSNLHSDRYELWGVHDRRKQQQQTCGYLEPAAFTVEPQLRARN